MAVSWDITSPSISGHHKMSLNDGSILLELPPVPVPFSIFMLWLLLLLLLFIAKDEEVAEAIASVAMPLKKNKCIFSRQFKYLQIGWFRWFWHFLKKFVICEICKNLGQGRFLNFLAEVLFLFEKKIHSSTVCKGKIDRPYTL